MRASVAPSVSPARAAEILRTHFGLVGRAEPLHGEHDANFRVTTKDHETYLLKLHAPAAKRAVVDLQAAALRHLATKRLPVAVPRPVASVTGTDVAFVDDPDGGTRMARLFTWLPGRVWAETGPHEPALLHSLGAAVARLDAGLADFEHPAMHRRYRWAMQFAADRREVLDLVSEPEQRDTARRVLERFAGQVLPHLTSCRAQVIHNDASDRNILVGADRRVVGLIDFGDLLHSQTVCGLAVACAYAMIGQRDPVEAASYVVAGYDTVTPLTDLELELLFDLIRTRLALSLCNAAAQYRDAPDNAYLVISQSDVWSLLRRLEAWNRHLAHFRFRDACGRAANPATPAIVRWLEVSGDRCAPVCRHDLRRVPSIVFDWSAGSAEATRVDELGGTPAVAEHLFRRIREAGAAVGIGRYRERRAVYRAEHFRTGESGRWRSVHMGIDLFLPAGEAVMAPLDGVVRAFADNARDGDYGPVVILEHETDQGVPFWTLYGHLSRDSLEGLAVGRRIARGESFARIGDVSENGNWPPHLHFQLLTHLLDQEVDVHGVVAPEDLDVWESISPNPNLVLGIPAACAAPARRDRDRLLWQRRRHVGPSLTLSYVEPLHLVRGEGAFLYDAEGTAYLDLVNNVCHVGHCHPRVVDAAARQMAMLNTNTRYLYDPLLAYLRRLLATFPEPLDVCYLVNSGSEANDLALRLARTVTGRRGVLALDHGYHGHLSSLVEISPYKFDGPGGTGRPPHVRVCEAPDEYRGRFTRDDAARGRRYAEDVAAQVRSLEKDGHGVAAFFAESALGCGGQIILPDGYLRAAYAHVRAAGGLCVADEVQIGVGRVGTGWWAFETQGVVPDIVTLGKPLGNGHPLGAVVTTREIAAAFDTGMEYFNTFGGNPVSAAVGLAVLDVIRDERLMPHARHMGQRLLGGLRDLARRHRLIGDVRGLGLFIGVELVRDRMTLEPATEETAQVIEQMKARGVLLASDGPFRNVLKVKPPLAIGEEDGNRFLDELDRALGTM